jgi:hypothetical protein
VVEACDRFAGFHVASRRARLYTLEGGNRILVIWHSGSDKPPAAHDIPRLRAIWFGDEDGIRVDAHEVEDLDLRQDKQFSQRPTAPRNPIARPRQTKIRGSATSGRDARFPTVEALAQSVKTETLRSLIFSLPRWVSDEFRGDAVADLRIPGTGQVRLRVLGEAAKIGWDFKQQWLSVWVNEPLPGDLDTLRSSLSNPESAKRNPSGYVSFRVHDHSDAEALQALVRRHIDAARRQAGMFR